MTAHIGIKLPEGVRFGMEDRPHLAKLEVDEAAISGVQGGGPEDPFFSRAYVDDTLQAEVMWYKDGRRCLSSSKQLTSLYVKGLGRRDGVRPDVMAADKAESWSTEMEGLGVEVDTEAMTVQLSEKRRGQLIDITREGGEWHRGRTEATAAEVRSMVGRLGAMTFVVRAGRYFTWKMLQQEGMNEKDRSGKWRRGAKVRLTKQFHHNVDLWRWVVRRSCTCERPVAAPSFLHVLRQWVIRWFSDASFMAIGGCCPELGLWWRWDLPESVKARLINRRSRRDFNSIFINQLELLAMVITAYVVCMSEGHKADPKEARPVLMRGDNMTAVHWVNEAHSDCEERASAMMRWLGVIEVLSGWCFSALHIPGKDNKMADGITRVEWCEIPNLLATLSPSTCWRQVELDPFALSLITSALGETSQLHQLETVLAQRTKDLSGFGETS
jgi:hypothetical protein